MTLASVLAQLRTEAWAMEPERLSAFCRKLAGITPEQIQQAHAAARAVPERGGPPAPGTALYELRGSTAVVPISGTLMRDVPSWFRYFGIDATSTTQVRAAVEAAAQDPNVGTILLHVSSPGGAITGMLETGDAIYEARKSKHVEAVVEDLCASGAYWLASQAHEITAPADALVGSIGVYQVIADYSAAAAREGVTVHVLRSGEHKGAGVAGAPISAAQLEALQGVINGLAAIFTAAVGRGRGKTPEQVALVATGQVWLAADGQTQGLVDQIQPVAKVFSRLAPKESPMYTKESQEAAAQAAALEASKVAASAERKRSQDLRTAFPKHPEFAAAQFELGASVEQAKIAYVDVLQADLDAERKTSAAARDEVAKARASAATIAPPAAAPLPRGGDPASAKGPDFMAAARAHAKEQGCSMTAAMSHVARTDPDLHEAYVLAQPRVSLSKKPVRTKG